VFQGALKLDPQDHETRRSLARVQSRAGQGDAAIKTLIQAIQRKKDYVEAYLDLARIYLDAKEGEPGAFHPAAGHSLNPNLASAHYLLSKALSPPRSAAGSG